MKDKHCTVIACSPLYFPWGYEEDEQCAALKISIYNTITFLRTKGICHFVIAMDSGAGLYAAELIRDMQETDAEISYDCYIPYEEQATKWTPELRDRYFSVFPGCRNMITISPEFTATCELEALIRAVCSAESLIAVCGKDDGSDYNTSIAIRYAELAGKNLYRICSAGR